MTRTEVEALRAGDAVQIAGRGWADAYIVESISDDSYGDGKRLRLAPVEPDRVPRETWGSAYDNRGLHHRRR